MKLPIPKEKDHIKPDLVSMYGSNHHQKALVVPEIIIEYGSISQKLATLPIIGKDMLKCMLELKKSMKAFNHQEITKAKISDSEMTQLIAYGQSLGLADIGFVDIKDNHYFRDSALMYSHAIVFTMAMEHSEIDTAPSLKANKEIFRTYYELTAGANKMSNYLKVQGFGAQAVGAISNNLNLTALARDAGLGEIGKHGLLISETCGPSLRIAAVLCNIDNLPQAQKKHEWIKSFCQKCNACLKGCPAKAIYDKPIEHAYGLTTINYEKCAIPFSKDYGCTLCVKNCTFYKSTYAKIKDNFLKI